MVVASTTGRPAVRCISNRAPAKGWTIAANPSAAASPAATIAARERPLASVAAWRVIIIDGSVSPMRLNSPYSKRSPGRPRDMNPAAFIAAENTSPEAPASSVRSRSKNAAPFGSAMTCDCSDIENGRSPAGGAGFST